MTPHRSAPGSPSKASELDFIILKNSKIGRTCDGCAGDWTSAHSLSPSTSPLWQWRLWSLITILTEQTNKRLCMLITCLCIARSWTFSNVLRLRQMDALTQQGTYFACRQSSSLERNTNTRFVTSSCAIVANSQKTNIGIVTWRCSASHRQ